MAWGWSLDAAYDLRIERNEKGGANTANRVDKPQAGTDRFMIPVYNSTGDFAQ